MSVMDTMHLQPRFYLEKKTGVCRGIPNYTPGIYADGYIVFAFPFVRSSVRMFVSSFVCSFVRSLVR